MLLALYSFVTFIKNLSRDNNDSVFFFEINSFYLLTIRLIHYL